MDLDEARQRRERVRGEEGALKCRRQGRQRGGRGGDVGAREGEDLGVVGIGGIVDQGLEFGEGLEVGGKERFVLVTLSRSSTCTWTGNIASTMGFGGRDLEGTESIHFAHLASLSMPPSPALAHRSSSRQPRRIARHSGRRASRARMPLLGRV